MSIIPDYFGMNSYGAIKSEHYGIVELIPGEVVGVTMPTDQTSISKQFVEYSVAIQRGFYLEVVHGVIAGVKFGGSADKEVYTLRPNTEKFKNQKGAGVGSKVLILFVNGQKSSGVILSGLPEQDQENLGHHYSWQFNGAKIDVNKDGELSLSFGGATNVQGELDEGVDEKNSGAFVSLTKDGSIKIQTKEDGQSLYIDHQNKKIVIKSDASLDIQSNGNVNIKSSGLLVGDANEAFVLGTTYRQAEGQLMQALSQSMSTISVQLAAVAAGLSVTAPAAAAAVTSIVPLFQAMNISIQQFEAQSARYLSNKNKGD